MRTRLAATPRLSHNASRNKTEDRAYNIAFCERVARLALTGGGEGDILECAMAPLRILANLYAAQKASREMTGGVLRYAATHPDVEVRLYGLGTAYRNIGDHRDWRPDGVIVSTEDASEIRQIERMGCRAAVLVNAAPPKRTRLRCGSVFCDNAAVAAAAVELFTRKRLRHTAYVGARAGEVWSLDREAAMRKCAAAAGCSFDAFAAAGGGRRRSAREADALAAWLAALPKPCGIFAANDLRAKDVIEACRAQSIGIPLQVMVLGADDEDFICRQMQPTLSSVVSDFGTGGFLAAQMLVELIDGRRGSVEPALFGVRGIVERASTSDPNEAGRMVGRAQEFIRENAATAGISVGDVAKASGASIRLLQKNFRAVTGATVSGTIQDERLRAVCALLLESATPIGRIAELCGFGDDAHLKKTFRRRFHCTMRDYRLRRVPGSDS